MRTQDKPSARRVTLPIWTLSVDPHFLIKTAFRKLTLYPLADWQDMKKFLLS
jgi:hypothetical protein